MNTSELCLNVHYFLFMWPLFSSALICCNARDRVWFHASCKNLIYFFERSFRPEVPLYILQRCCHGCSSYSSAAPPACMSFSPLLALTLCTWTRMWLAVQQHCSDDLSCWHWSPISSPYVPSCCCLISVITTPTLTPLLEPHRAAHPWVLLFPSTYGIRFFD